MTPGEEGTLGAVGPSSSKNRGSDPGSLCPQHKRVSLRPWGPRIRPLTYTPSLRRQTYRTSHSGLVIV